MKASIGSLRTQDTSAISIFRAVTSGLTGGAVVLFVLKTPSPAVFFLITFTFFLVLALAVGIYAAIVSFNAYRLPRH